MNNKPLYIFDLDGTMAIIDHRRHWVQKEKPSCEDWHQFHIECEFDVPNTSVIQTMEILRNSGADIWIFSGRSDEVREMTENWLMKHANFNADELQTALSMRIAGDFTPDDELKLIWLANMLDEDRNRLVAVFDDRDRVVQMWRQEGISCFQVALGNF
ncbi:phosphatase domain-containing protein [Undibacterium flavidum]|uniref:Polynucleotide kinase PNKP phosphatase domain-containing protein n=1 Tax=Undibacterium flavidum TaxID=2762297 RepID=A0ABR6Y7R4_9BURK|nr:hypothetical protein [Undibacterium flavidum]MBC3872641.1 hypothetical protein [Undibacterium flavidum]